MNVREMRQRRSQLIAQARALFEVGEREHRDMTQEELAQLVGASRETVNKALADFVHRGWLRVEQRSVTITDLERLTRRAR